MKAVRESFKDRFEAQLRITPGCWIWLGNTVRAYGSLTDDEGRTVYAHRVSYTLYVNPIPKGLHILHTCDNPLCVNPGHLWPGTNFQNVQDKMKKGRYRGAPGAKHGRAKLTTQEVKEIRDLSRSRLFTVVAIGIWYGVSHATVTRIKNGSQRPVD